MIRVRFAPSPTGNLHLGTLRTALFSWLFARNKGGVTVLRIEDTDLERSNPEYETSILEGLNWLGLDFDEGPENGGDYGPYRQSERMALGIYQKIADELISKGHAYRCFCTSEELDAEREEAEKNGKAYVYSRTCLDKSESEIEALLSQNTPYTIRFKLPDHHMTFSDLVRGEITFDMSLMSDFVMMKSDGSPTYNFACVVDDHDMAISHVVRGEDHISNTPKQIAVYNALDYPVPEFAHLPMILGPDKSKLSKRHGATNVIDYRDNGFLSEALFNFMSLLGWSPPDETEILDKDEIVRLFSFERVGKAGAIFDQQKLRWMNGQYIRGYDADAFHDLVMPYVSETNQSMLLSSYVPGDLPALLMTLRDSVEVLPDINDLIVLFTASDDDVIQKATSEFDFSDSDKNVFKVFLEALSAGGSPLTYEGVHDALTATLDTTGLGKGKVFRPIRMAGTGEKSGPDLPEVLRLLGLERLRTRLEAAIYA